MLVGRKVNYFLHGKTQTDHINNILASFQPSAWRIHGIKDHATVFMKRDPIVREDGIGFDR